MNHLFEFIAFVVVIALIILASIYGDETFATLYSIIG